MKSISERHNSRASRPDGSGFTLIEFLITITIIIVSAGLSMIGVNGMNFSAAGATSINQMRQVGTAALSWEKLCLALWVDGALRTLPNGGEPVRTPQ